MLTEQNTSRYYSMMLLAQAFTRLLKERQSRRLGPAQNLHCLMLSVPATLMELFIQVIQHQEADGSWCSKREVTAYAILALSALLALPWELTGKALAVSSIQNGQRYLLEQQHLWSKGESLWIEKVAHSSSNLSLAYCIAAANVSLPHECSKITEMPPVESRAGSAKYAEFFSRLATLSDLPSWKLGACSTQSGFFVARLKELELEISPGIGKPKAHNYVDFIPLTWVACNYLYGSGVPTRVLWEMMVISMLDFQADSYMESFVAENFGGRLGQVRDILDRAIMLSCPIKTRRASDVSAIYGSRSLDIFAQAEPKKSASVLSKGDLMVDEPLRELEATLVTFAMHVLTNSLVLRSPEYLQTWLSQSLHAFLNAHITHIEDCMLHANEEFPKETYYKWVHTTSAEHTSCLYSFVFYLCLLHGERTTSGQEASDLFPNLITKYMLEYACTRLATICRQHNDFGSVARDAKEGNLNSVNFPELGSASGVGSPAMAQAKKNVLILANFERKQLDLTLSELRDQLHESTLKEVMLFFHVTDLYGEIYLSRDMTPSLSSLKES